MIEFIRSFKEIKKFKNLNKEYKNIVFYSEDNNYSFFFKEIIDELLNRGRKVSLITSDKKDIFLDYKNKNIKVFNISNFFLLQYFFSNIECKNFILTTPDLGSGILNKSPFTKKYIYIFHSLISTTVAYKKNAFKNYDIFFCPSKLHLHELTKYFDNLKKNVDLLKIGYPKINELKNFKPSNIDKKNKILIAPTWGADGVINKKEIIDLIKKLLLERYKVIFRPHPMSFQKDKISIEKILKQFREDVNFYLSNEKNNLEVFYNCECLITDWSGAAMEFSLAFKKPSIFLNTDQRIRNKEIKKGNPILSETFENICRDKLGIILNASEYESVVTKLNDIKNNPNIYLENIKKFEQEYLFNVDNALENTVDELARLSDI